jgi:general secretion pathway protein H
VEAAVRQRGFTLIELLVTLGVVALLAAAAVPALRGVSGANARQAAGELSGALRYLFDTAALRHTTCRMALDLEHHAWWAECGQGAQAVARDTDRRRAAETSLEDRFPDEHDADRRRLLAKTSFGEFVDRLVPRRELPGSVTLGEIRVEGRSSPIATGVAYVHFFAGGQAQRAFIPVVDGTTVYTVVVEPFSGRARVVVGRVEEELK